MLTGTLRPIKILSLFPLAPAKIPHVKRISNIKEADFSFSYQDLTFFIKPFIYPSVGYWTFTVWIYLFVFAIPQ
jgi:hypothetical protein